MIDLAPLKAVSIDRATRVARVQPGVWLGEMDRAAQAQGLIVPAGTVSHTGVAGLTLGGGFGRLSRRYGLTIDSLQSADVITTAGQRVRASEQENEDLFWALRGGGGNFGVVSSFEYRAHPLTTKLVGGDLTYPIDQARSVLGALAEMAEKQSHDLWIDPVLECDAAGSRRLLVNLCHCGDERAAARDIAAVRKLGKPSSENIGARAFVKLQSDHDGDSPHGRSYYMSGGLVQGLSSQLLDHVVECIQQPGAELGKISLTQHGGAIASVAPTATAFANRTASHNAVIRAAWDDPRNAAKCTAWQKETWKGIVPHTQGLYANLNLGDADPRIIAAYGPNLRRLRELKAKYDPKNFFRLNPNIPPAA
jgi:FAD/FMN-containing dehydrogenase